MSVQFLPPAATLSTGWLVWWAMNPNREKIANPANTLVPQLMNATMTESRQQLFLNWLKLDMHSNPPNAGPRE